MEQSTSSGTQHNPGPQWVENYAKQFGPSPLAESTTSKFRLYHPRKVGARLAPKLVTNLLLGLINGSSNEQLCHHIQAERLSTMTIQHEDGRWHSGQGYSNNGRITFSNGQSLSIPKTRYRHQRCNRGTILRGGSFYYRSPVNLNLNWILLVIHGRFLSRQLAGIMANSPQPSYGSKLSEHFVNVNKGEKK